METVGISQATQNDVFANQQEQSTMGKDDFLQLLVAQLKHQDPMNPMQNTEFASQLAEYSSLEQLQQLNESAQSELILGQSLNNSFMTSIIGRDIKAYGNGISFKGGDVELNYNLSRAAESFEVNIYDDEGTLVRTIEGNGNKTGEQTLEWDGRDDDGDLLDNGDYTFDITASDVDGVAVSAATYNIGEVSGISYEQGSPYFVINGQYVNLGDVISIMSPQDEVAESGNSLTDFIANAAQKLVIEDD